MAYRKIVVNDITYEYVIGKQYTKIKDFDIIRNEDIGTQIRYSDKYLIGPRHVAFYIKN